MPQDGMTSLPQDQAATLSSSDPASLAILQQIAEQQTNQKLVGWVNTEYEKLKNQRILYERQWFINLAFYAGRQNVAPISVAGSGFKLVSPKAPPWRVRLVINKIRTAVRTECSKLTMNKPIPVVVPATTEDEDYASARVAESILKSEFATEEHEALTRNWVWWGSTTGNAYIKSYWDPSKVDERATITPLPDPQAVMLAQQVGVPLPPPVPQPAQGKVCFEVVNPFHFFVPDLLATEIEDQPYVMHVTTKSPDWVKNTFPQFFPVPPTPDSKSANNLLEAAVLSPLGVSNNSFDSVLVKEVWFKPGHPHFPEGGMLTVIADKVVQKITQWKMAVPFSEYPFYAYEGIPTGGFYKESIVTDLIPVQKEYNKTRSQAIEIKNMMTKPRLMGPKGAINPRMISSEPGQYIPYTPGYEKPTVLQPVEVPATYLNEIATLNAEFDDISGQHEITRGNTPSQVTSGTAISFLQEQDDTKLAYQVAGIERNKAKMGRHYLKYAERYWQDGRTVKIVGQDGAFESQLWQKNAMQGNTDVIIQSGSALPYSKAARMAQVTDLIAQGLIDPMQGLELLDLAGLDKILEDHLIDKRAAQRENLKMAEAPPEEIAKALQPPVGPDGQPIEGWQPQSPMPVNSWDNHQAHIHYHNQYRKTQQFELLPDPIKQMFELHVQTHQYALMLTSMGAAGPIMPPVPEEDEEGPDSGGEAGATNQDTGEVDAPQ